MLSCDNEQKEFYQNGNLKRLSEILPNEVRIEKLFDSSGFLQKKIRYENNLANGLTEEYYSNGGLKYLYYNINDTVEGIYLAFDSLGCVKDKRKYIKGKIYGISKEYENKILKRVGLYYKSKSKFDVQFNNQTPNDDYFDIIIEDTVEYGKEIQVTFDFTNYRNISGTRFIIGTIDESDAFYLKDSDKVFVCSDNQKLTFKDTPSSRGRNFLEGIVYLVWHTDTVITIGYPIREQFYVK